MTEEKISLVRARLETLEGIAIGVFSGGILGVLQGFVFALSPAFHEKIRGGYMEIHNSNRTRIKPNTGINAQTFYNSIRDSATEGVGDLVQLVTKYGTLAAIAWDFASSGDVTRAVVPGNFAHPVVGYFGVLSNAITAGYVIGRNSAKRSENKTSVPSGATESVTAAVNQASADSGDIPF